MPPGPRRPWWLPAALLVLGLAACSRVGSAPTPPAPAATQPPVTPSATALTLTATPAATHTAASPTPSAGPTPTTTPRPKVVIISIDGLRPDAAQMADMPNLDALAARGAYTWNAQTIYPPVTLPAHASMLSGVGPEVHGILWNDNQPSRGFIGVPTIFSVARQAGLRTVLVAGKEKFQHYNVPGTVDRYTFVTTGDQFVADQAIAEVAAGFDLLFVHFPNTDYFGHLAGWMSPTQLAQLGRTDDALGRLFAALPADTVIILSADHGGHGLAHGVDIPEDMTIPWIIAGPGVRENFALTQLVSTTDTAITAAYVLGLTFPGAPAGRAVLAAFTHPQPLVTPTPLPSLLNGAWSEGAPQSPARSEMPGVYLNGLIYVPGGYGGETVFQAYDPARDTWTDLDPLPEGRNHAMAAALDGRVYVLGGAQSGGPGATSTTFAYDPATNTWARRADLPEARAGGAAVALDGRLYVVGGVGDTADLLAYDPAADAWTRLAALVQPRDHLAAAVLNGEIYALGGRWPAAGELRTVEIYDPAANQWRLGAPMLGLHSGFSAAGLHGHLLVAGGELILTGRAALDAFEIYDPATQTWAAGPPLPFALHGEPAVADDQRLYLLGGSDVPGDIVNFGRTLIYTP